jgi:hypothetical protein
LKQCFEWFVFVLFSASEPCLCLQLDVVASSEENGGPDLVEEEWEAPIPPSTPTTSVSRSLRLPLLHSAKFTASMKSAGFRQATGSNLQGLLKSQV